MPGLNNMYAPQMPIHSTMYGAPDHNANYVAQRPTPKLKVDLNPPEPMVQNGDKGKKKKANKAGPKETWVPKST